MEKFLKYDFFKTRGFLTKASGLAFMKQQGLDKIMEEKAQEIEDFKDTKINEFEEEFDKHDAARKVYILSEKDKQRERRQDKKEMEKKALKDALREEILQELENERKEQVRKDLINKYANLIPQVDIQISVSDILQDFVSIAESIAKGQLVLEPDTKKKLSSLSNQTVKIANALQDIKTELSNIKCT